MDKDIDFESGLGHTVGSVRRMLGNGHVDDGSSIVYAWRAAGANAIGKCSRGCDFECVSAVRCKHMRVSTVQESRFFSPHTLHYIEWHYGSNTLSGNVDYGHCI